MSVTGGSKDYASISRQLDTALSHVDKAKKTTDPTRKDNLSEADNILSEIGKELLSTKAAVEGHESILKVLEKYQHVLKKYDEVSTYAASDEQIVRGASLERVKLFFNRVLHLSFGDKKEFNKALELLDGKVTGLGGKTVKVDLEKIEGDYKQLHSDLLRNGKVDENKLNQLKEKLALLHIELEDYGVHASPEKATKNKNTAFQNLGSETKEWSGAGALRRKLVIELAKVEALQARLEDLENAEAPKGVPQFEGKPDKIKKLPATRLEADVRQLRAALGQVKSGTLEVSPEQVGRMELALKQYTDAFNKKMAKLVKLDQKFSVGEVIGEDPKQISESIALAQAKFFTFNEPHDAKAGIYLGKLTAYLALTSDQSGNHERLLEIRQRLESDPQMPNQRAMNEFEGGFKSILGDRARLYESGTSGLEGVISKLVSTHDTATVREKALIGEFLGKVVEPLSERTIPAVVMMRLTSALKAPSDVKPRETVNGVLTNLVVRVHLGGKEKSDDVKALFTYLGKVESQDQVEVFRAALVKRAIEDLPNGDESELLVFRQVFDSLQSKVPGLLSEETEKALNGAMGLGVQAQLQAAFEGNDTSAVNKALSFAAKFPNDFLQENVKGLQAPQMLINSLKALLAAAPAPTDSRRDPAASYTALEKELELAEALFPGNSAIKELSDGLKAKQEDLKNELASRTPWLGAADLSARLQGNGADIKAIQGEMQKAIDGALSRKDSAALSKIEADLENLRVNKQLSPEATAAVTSALKQLQTKINSDEELANARYKSLLPNQITMPELGKGRNKDQVSQVEVRDFLGIVKGGERGKKDVFDAGLDEKVREDIAACLLDSSGKTKLSEESSMALIAFYNSAKDINPPRAIPQARAMALLAKYGTGRKGQIAVGTYGKEIQAEIKQEAAKDVGDLSKFYEELEGKFPAKATNAAEEGKVKAHYALIELYSTEIVHIANLQRIRDALPEDEKEFKALIDDNIAEHRGFLEHFFKNMKGKSSETFVKEMPDAIAQFDFQKLLEADEALNKKFLDKLGKEGMEESVTLVMAPGVSDLSKESKLVDGAADKLSGQGGFVTKRFVIFGNILKDINKELGRSDLKGSEENLKLAHKNYETIVGQIDENLSKDDAGKGQ